MWHNPKKITTVADQENNNHNLPSTNRTYKKKQNENEPDKKEHKTYNDQEVDQKELNQSVNNEEVTKLPKNLENKGKDELSSRMTLVKQYLLAATEDDNQ